MASTMWRLVAAGALVGLLSGCAQSFDATSLGVPATMAAAAGDPAAGQPFQIRTHTVHAFWGVVQLKEARLDRALASQLVGGNEIAQLKIRTKSRWTDLLITGLTLGIVAPKTVIYEGVVVGR
ncbi:MAG: hypothetical protein KF785_09275 [Gemmatimonadales bacterium]|nr:hypothetical protein [Gemmatimonadales bacterium]